jgi:hypothetical protein
MTTKTTKTTPLTIKAAIQTVGSDLGKPSKMPGRSFGISALRCKIGAALRRRKGSVCSDCYALKGRYPAESVAKAHERRGDALDRALASIPAGDEWVQAMAFLINKRGKTAADRYFRWHDSGDLQSVEHLRLIVRVCEITPTTAHWLPTREIGMVRAFLDAGGEIPANLNIRVSSYFIGARPLSRLPQGLTTSTVSWAGAPRVCPAPTQGGKCGPCRACWDRTVPSVDYKQH